jgi:hypothetical protein
MRLDKRSRRALKELRRRKQQALKRAAAVEGQPSIRGSLISLIPSAGTSKPGAELFRLDKAKDKPKYSIDRQPRLSSKPKHSGQV